MAKYFVDCGAHRGKILKHFMKSHKDYYAYAFEPNPNTDTKIPVGAMLLRKAVWIENCVKPFYLYSKDKTSEGCTLMEEKTNGGLDKDHPIMVECIDFSKWLRQTFCSTSKITLKMDIEGAEYAVLAKMIKDETIGMISKLYVEFHWQQCGIAREFHHEFKQKLKEHVRLLGEYSRVHGL